MTLLVPSFLEKTRSRILFGSLSSMHGKNDVSLEQIDCSDKAMDKEAQTDELASDTLLLIANERAVVLGGIKDLEDKERYAHEFKTHPSVILGRVRCRLFFEIRMDNGMSFKCQPVFPDVKLQEFAIFAQNLSRFSWRQAFRPLEQSGADGKNRPGRKPSILLCHDSTSQNFEKPDAAVAASGSCRLHR